MSSPTKATEPAYDWPQCKAYQKRKGDTTPTRCNLYALPGTEYCARHQAWTGVTTDAAGKPFTTR